MENSRNVMGIELVARAYDPRTDRGFVAGRWRAGLPLSRLSSLGDPYHGAVRALVDHLLANSRISVVCSASSPTTLHAFAAGGVDVLLYAHVERKLRGHGLGTLAIRHALAAADPRVVHCALAWPWPSVRYRHVLGERAQSKESQST